MRLPIWVVVLAAIVGLAAVVVIGATLLQPPRPLITEAGFAPGTITPDADGQDDVTVFKYGLSRGATISVDFTAPDGTIYAFRRDEPRTAGDHSVLFSGVVDGFTLPGDAVQGEILRRLMPDGTYTWTLTAEDEAGETMTQTGDFVITGGDSSLPDIPEFTVFPNVFTPNQDGISDRTAINVGLVKPANIRLFLQREDMEPIYVPERLEDRPGDNEPVLRHLYDYEGGVDLGANPPPDGTYTVVAEAQDEVGQRVRRTGTLTIASGGKPQAQIMPQPTGPTVIFEARPWEDRFASTSEQRGDLVDPPADPQSLALTAVSMPVGDMLVFQLTVENYSDVPIRTSGSQSGTVYDWTQRASTFGEFDESGSWRVGIDCDTAASDYPWRWRLGDDEALVTEIDPNTGTTYTYLPAGARATVWGAVRMSQIEVRNPQNCWAGLIHEDVGVSELNAYVGPRQVELLDPTGQFTPN
jgi:PKD repeat protein